MSKHKIFSAIIFICCTLVLSAKDYKASLFGVKSDGITLNTGSIQKAVDFISENGGGRLVFYVGRYLTGSIQLRSNVTVHLEEGAVLVGVPTVYDYDAAKGVKALIYAEKQDSIGITGKGVIEGQGTAVLAHIRAQMQKGYLKESLDPARPALISLAGCTNVNIGQINLFNACGDVQVYQDCSQLTIGQVTVKSRAVAGSRGIVFSGCNGLKLSHSFFDTSGTELSSAGTSNNVMVINTISPAGKKIRANK
jgi:polygalacturonase